MMTGQRVLVAIDGSEGGQRAARWAARFASDQGAEIIAVHVLTYSSEFWRDLPPTGLTTWRQQLKEQFEGDWTDEARGTGADVRCILLEADSVEGGIMQVADEEDVDLIVLGAHGHADLLDRLLGPVTYRVSHSAHRPVVIVPVDWKRARVVQKQ